MKISVITVCYNSEATIRECLASVALQTGAEVEHIVVDGASRDGTVSIIKEFSDRPNNGFRYVSEPDKGIYDAMNKGIGLATGELVGFLNADDFFANERVVQRISQHVADSKADGCYGDLDLVDPNDTNKTVRHWRSGVMPKSKLRAGWHPAHPTFYVKRALIEGSRGFRTKYRIAADYELMMRLIMIEEAKLVYLPEVFVKMRAGGASNRSLKHIWQANIQCYQAWRDNGLAPPLMMVPRKLAWKAMQRLRGAFS